MPKDFVESDITRAGGWSVEQMWKVATRPATTER
jgi:hypothetical protein